jgi:hypothetical protein
VSATEALGTALPNASVAVTFTAGVIATPATTLEGCVVNASAAAAACETVNAVLVAVSRPLEAVSVLLPTEIHAQCGERRDAGRVGRDRRRP